MAWKAIEINDDPVTEAAEATMQAKTSEVEAVIPATAPDNSDTLHKHICEIEFTLKAILAHMQSKESKKSVITYNERHDG